MQRRRMGKEETQSDSKWWVALPVVRALKKLRDWSKQVAGPKLKTFIQRFNCKIGVSCAGGVIATKNNNTTSSNREWQGDDGQYDAVNYGLNFDEGQKGRTDEDDRLYPDFTSRYAAVSGGGLSTKPLMNSSDEEEVNPFGRR